MNDMNTLLRFFPEHLRQGWITSGLNGKTVREIRIRVNMPVRVIGDEETILSMQYGEREIEEIFRHLCHDSVYAYDSERRQGYMVVEGGHRIGITGELEPSDHGGFIVKYVRYMNIRIAHQIINAARSVMPYICCRTATKTKQETAASEKYSTIPIYSTLIISPPGLGKTTILRDMIRMVSDGFAGHRGCNVGVVDERGEIAGAYRGKAVLDCGVRTDIVTGGDKSHGIDVLVRTFSPRVIAIDEIGKSADAEAILHAGVSGCSVLATVHGSSITDIWQKGEMVQILRMKLFERFVLLSADDLLVDRTKRAGRYFSVYDREGNVLCGRSLLQEPVS